MHAPRIDLFEWLLQKSPQAIYNLAYSNITGVTNEEYQKYNGFSIPDDFDLGINAQYGADELKKILCDMYKTTFDNIVTTTGASEANFLVFSALLSPHDDFIIEQPGYQPMWLTPEMLGAQKIIWPRRFKNNFCLDIELLNKLFTKKTKLVVLTNLHNPSGVVTDRNSIRMIAKIAEEHNACVLIDEIFLDGSFIPHPSAFGIPNVIVSSSATKVYGLGGLHTGWIVAPGDIAKQCQRLKAHSTGASSYMSEIMTASVLRDARGSLLERFQQRARTNLEILTKWMKEHTEFFEWVKPDGGIVCFPKYSMQISSLELCLYLFETQKILLNPGIFFNAEGFIRLSYGIDEVLLQNALDALERGLKSLQTRV
jgi:aspartate/methionine/tyrosine aminotransferase